MNRLRHLLVALAAIAALVSTPAHAQTPTAGMPPAISELEGIQAGIGRTWSLDYEAIMADATPGSVDLNNWQGLSALSVQILQFDSDDHAAAAFDLFQASIAGEIPNLGQGGTPVVSSEQLDNLGDGAVASTLVTNTDAGESHLRNVAVLDDQLVILVSSLAGTAESAAAAEALAAYIVNQGEVSPDPVSFDPAGISKGGLWGVMPAAGDPVLEGLIVVRDDQLYPLPRVNA
jgi:hypothetical protein